jgi:hypothetical protein
MNWLTFFAGIAATLLAELLFLFGWSLYESRPWQR